MTDRDSELVSRTAELTERFQQAGADAPDRGALADDAIACCKQALDVLDSADPRRARVTFRLANLIAIRRVALGGGLADQDAAIAAFEGYLEAPGQPQGDTEIARYWLGLLLVFRALQLPVGNFGQPPDQRALMAMMASHEPGPNAAADADRAVDVLGALAEGEAAHPPLQRWAAGMQAMASLLKFNVSPRSEAGHDAGNDAGVMALLQTAMRTMTPDDPGQAELSGLHAWLSAENARTAGVTSEAALRDLDASMRDLSPDHMLHAVLQLELGLSTAQQAMHQGGGPELRRAADYLEQARTEMAGWPGHPMYDDSLRQLAGALVSSTAWDPDPAAIEKVIGLATQVAASRDESDVAGVAKDTYLLGMAHALRAARSHQPRDWAAASDELHRALTLIPAEDPMAATMLATFGGVLNDRYQRYGGLADADAAQLMLSRAGEILDHRTASGQSPSDHELLTTVGLQGVCRVALAWRTRDLAGLEQGQAEIQRALDGLPASYAWRSRLTGGKGLAQVAAGVLTPDMSLVQKGVAALNESAESMAVDIGSRAGIQSAGAMARIMAGLLREDPKLMAQGIGILTELAAGREITDADRPWLLWGLGFAHLTRHGKHGSRADLDLGIAWLEQGYDRIAGDPGNPVSASLLGDLARAYRRRAEADGQADDEESIETGLAALHARVADVLLQSGAVHSLVIARGAAEEAATVAAWCLADRREQQAVQALELGRGLALHAATVAAGVPELLRRAGHDALAAEWEQADTALSGGWAGPGSAQEITGAMVSAVLAPESAPSDIRPRVLTALARVAGIGMLLTPPSTADIAAGLTASQADALVFMLPGTGAQEGLLLAVFADQSVRVIPAAALRLDPDGPVLAFAAVHEDLRSGWPDPGGTEDTWSRWKDALTAVSGWAWAAGIAPLLSHLRRRRPAEPGHDRLPRVVLVPGGLLGAVPWHAAWRDAADGTRAYACREVVLTYAASARQFVEVSGRSQRPVGESPVFVADPTRSRDGALIQTLALREVFYPGSLGYGHTGQPGDPAGTPEQVLGHLPGPGRGGASLLQFSCHGVSAATAEESWIELAGASPDVPSEQLEVQRILRHAQGRDPAAPGGLVVLTACESDLTAQDYDEALTLATAFLAAGAAAVVGTRWEVSGRVTPILMFMFHHFLRKAGLPAAQALQATQDWALNPAREIPAAMPPLLRGDVAYWDLSDITAWAAFTHHGA